MRDLILGILFLSFWIFLVGCSSNEIKQNPPVSPTGSDSAKYLEVGPVDSLNKEINSDSLELIPETSVGAIPDSTERTKPPPSRFPPGKYIDPEIKK